MTRGPGEAEGRNRPSLSESLRPRGPVQLSIEHYERAGATVIALRGELDILTAPRFSAFLAEIMRRRPRDVVVDLTEVRFVDSAGLQVLLSARRRITRGARWRALICPPGPVLRVMDLARLTEALAVMPSLDEYDRQAAADVETDQP